MADYLPKFRRGLQTIRSYLDPGLVGYLIAFVTTRCNFRCKFCFAAIPHNQKPKSEELTVTEFDRIARSLGPLVQLSIGGGEPFLRDDLAEITSLFIERCSVRYLTLPTNAWYSGQIGQYLETLLPRYPWTNFRMVFSIDGIGSRHDELRQTPGAYEHMLASYKIISPLRKRFKNFVLDSNSVFQKDTEEELPKTIEVLHKEFSFDNISVTYVRGKIRDPELCRVSANKYLELYDQIRSLKKQKENRFLSCIWRGINDVSRDYLVKIAVHNEFVVPCVAGTKLIVLRENGDVFPCEILSSSMGNIRDYGYDMQQLLSIPENIKLVRWIRETKCKCTFECALAANVLWNRSSYPKLIRGVVRNACIGH